MTTASVAGGDTADTVRSIAWLDMALPLLRHWRWIVGGSLLAGLLGYAATFAFAPTFTARTSLLPPQQQQSSTAVALASLGALAGMAGAGSGVKSPADQYVGLLLSETVAERLIERFDLMQVYRVRYLVDARRALAENVRVNVGKKDGLLNVEVDDHDPARAAALANGHVEELRHLTSRLALSEAQQRRAFFEEQFRQTRDRLTEAQLALQRSGIDAGTLKAEPRAATEIFASLRAQLTAAEVRLRTLQQSLTPNATEVRQQQALVDALTSQVAKATRPAAADGSESTYLDKYREFKYQESLLELFAKQYEMARLDEAREGALIQVVDVAKPPEKRSRPRRLLVALGTLVGALVLLSAWFVGRHLWRQALADPATSAQVARLRSAR